MKRHSGDDDLSSSDIHERLLVSSRGVGGIIGKESSVKVAGDHFHWLVRTVDEIIENNDTKQKEYKIRLH
ncbi:hypothetical protein QQG55_54730 [Brugia pahangi]